MISLRFFSAEAPAHPANFNNHIVSIYPEHFGNECLCLGRVLRGAEYADFSSFAWNT